MIISISANAYSLLRDHIRPDNVGYSPVITATKISSSVNGVAEFWIDCGKSEAESYLAIARKNILLRKREIEQAIVHAWQCEKRPH